ncbi:MAG TPA: hypothetical protein VFK05_14860, partial [Polyangiaceae bacterium]|nr:hypothetical protein [Polyangiaceae bacterium]
MIRLSLGASVLLAFVTMAGVSRAEEGNDAETPVRTTAPPAAEQAHEEPASDGHATGLMIQARVQSQSGLLSLAGGGTGFLVG